jgi:hypothetical protein
LPDLPSRQGSGTSTGDFGFTNKVYLYSKMYEFWNIGIQIPSVKLEMDLYKKRSSKEKSKSTMQRKLRRESNLFENKDKVLNFLEPILQVFNT